MLHTGVRHDHKLVAVLIKGILPKPMFERLDRARYFFKVSLGPFALSFKHPIINVQSPRFAIEFVSKMNVVANVQTDRVVIDRIFDFPLKRSRFVLLRVRLAGQAAIGNGF